MQNTRVTTFTISELLRENQQGVGKITPPTQIRVKVPKTIKRNATRYFIMKFPNKRGLQQIASNHSSDIDFKDFMKLCKDYTKEPYSF